MRADFERYASVLGIILIAALDLKNSFFLYQIFRIDSIPDPATEPFESALFPVYFFDRCAIGVNLCGNQLVTFKLHPAPKSECASR